MTMERRAFEHDGLTFSYLDAGGDGRALIALHAHLMEAATFSPLAAALTPEWRVVALDQRGQGYSGHAASYGWAEYLGDLTAFLDHLGLEHAVMLGNSLGGVNAYQFAALHPERVGALVIEDFCRIFKSEYRSFVFRPWKNPNNAAL
jgi:esterase